LAKRPTTYKQNCVTFFNRTSNFDSGTTIEFFINGSPSITRLTTFKSYNRLFILMNRMISVAFALVLSLGLLFTVSAALSPLFGQKNQTNNMTSMQPQQQGQQEQQQNQTGIGSASEIENITAGNIPVLGNVTETESQNDSSLTEGLQREQMTTDTNMTTNQTGGGTTNGTTNQTEEGEQEQDNQTEKGPLEQIGETISGIFGGGNQSN
jgi:hypothetical protein